MPAQTPKSSAYLPPCGSRPGHAEDPQADARARADDQRQRELPLHVAQERALHPLDERRRSGRRRKAPVDRSRKSIHVEQHVDRHDDDEHDAEQQADDGESCAFRPVQRLRRVLLDVFRPDRREELLSLLLHLHALQVMRVEPVLQACEILRRAGLVGASGLGRKVGIDAVAGGSRLLHDDGCESEDRECKHCCEAHVDDRDRQAARDPDPSQPRTSGLRSRAMSSATRKMKTT